MRAHARYDPVMGELIYTHEKLKEVHKELVTFEPISLYLSYVDYFPNRYVSKWVMLLADKAQPAT